MRTYIELEISRKQDVLERVICDSCYSSTSNEDEFIRFYSNHYEWGNDSVDGIKDWDVCSIECYLNLAKKLAREDEINEHRNSLLIDNKPYRFFLDKKENNETKKV